MKKSYSAALCCVLFPVVALAQTLAPAVVPAPVATPVVEKKTEKVITTYGLIGGYTNLYDSRNSKTVNVDWPYVRLGGKIKYDAISGQFELGYTGNSTDDTSGSTAGSNLVGVRRADLNIKFPTNTSISIGRIRPEGAGAWGADPVGAPQGYSGVDGVRLSQSFDISENHGANFAVTMGDSMRGLIYGSEFTPGTQSNMADDAWDKKDKAYVFNSRISVKGYSASLNYGMEKNAFVEILKETTPTGTDGSKNDVIKISEKHVADLGNLQASLGYDAENWGAGGFLEMEVIGKTSKVAANNAGKLVLDPAIGGKNTVTVAGIGANADSTLFGIKDKLVAGDKFTAGISVDQTTKRAEGGVVANEKKSDAINAAIGIGYAVSGFNTDLVYQNQSTTDKTFSDASGQSGVKAMAHRVYLASFWSF